MLWSISRSAFLDAKLTSNMRITQPVSKRFWCSPAPTTTNPTPWRRLPVSRRVCNLGLLEDGSGRPNRVASSPAPVVWDAHQPESGDHRQQCGGRSFRFRSQRQRRRDERAFMRGCNVCSRQDYGSCCCCCWSEVLRGNPEADAGGSGQESGAFF